MIPFVARLFLSLLLIASLSSSSAQPNFWFYSCGKSGNYTNTSTFAANLDIFLTSLTSGSLVDVNNTHFYNLTIGKKSGDDLVSGEAYCRGDLSSADCHSCSIDAAGEIRQICPNQKEAIGWYRDCTIRYANRQIVGTLSTSPKSSIANPTNASDPAGFSKQLNALLRRLQAKVVAEKILKYESGSVKVNGSESIYAVLQCTQDLNSSSCYKCVDALINYVPICCYGKIGGVILIPNCATRFDIYQFYQSGDTPTSSSAITKRGNSRRKKQAPLRFSASITMCTFVAVLLTIVIWIGFRRQKRIKMAKREIEEIIVADSLQFDLNTIKAATNNFSADNKLGEGGF